MGNKMFQDVKYSPPLLQLKYFYTLTSSNCLILFQENSQQIQNSVCSFHSPGKYAIPSRENTSILQNMQVLCRSLCDMCSNCAWPTNSPASQASQLHTRHCLPVWNLATFFSHTLLISGSPTLQTNLTLPPPKPDYSCLIIFTYDSQLIS